MMTNFEDDLLRDSVRRFVDKEMSPQAMRGWARAGDFPEHVFQHWAQMGWLALGQPEE